MAKTHTTRCEKCNRKLNVNDSVIGKIATCPGCGEDILVSVATPLKEDQIDTAFNEEDTNSGIRVRDHRSMGHPQRIGRFEIKGELGQGAFGTVYKAFDPVLSRHVAIKTPRFSTSERERVKRFHTEAAAAAKLRHPNIVAVHESGEVGGVSYIVSELVVGVPLAEYLATHDTNDIKAADWARSLATALSYAHEEGVIHRDIKPDNIMLNEQRRPMIMDFGLAKITENESTMTTDGSILGTPAYMSPEQARGDTENVGPPSDQYSLGVVLFEMLTKQKPYSGSSHLVIANVASDEPAPSPKSVNSLLSRDLDAICRKAMNKESQQRYDSLGRMADDLGNWLAGKETMARPMRPMEHVARWCYRNRGIAALSGSTVLLMVVILVLAVSAYYREADLRHDAIVARLEADAQRSEAIDQRDVAREALAKAEAARLALETAQQRESAARTEMETAKRQENATQQFALSIQTEAESAARLVRQRHQADARLARSYLQQGQQLCRKGEVSAGLLWFGRGLQVLPDDEPALDYELRTAISKWHRQTHELKWMWSGRGEQFIAHHKPSATVCFATQTSQGFEVYSAREGIEPDAPVIGDGQILGVALRENGNVILTVASDVESAKIELWNRDTRTNIGSGYQISGAAQRVLVSDDGMQVLVQHTTSPDLSLVRWDNSIDGWRKLSLHHKYPPAGVYMNGGGDAIVTRIGLVRRDDNSRRNEFRFWNPRTAQLVGQPVMKEGHGTGHSLSPGGRFLLLKGYGGLQLLDALSGRPIGGSMRKSSLDVSGFSSDSARFAIGCNSYKDSRIDIYNLLNPKAKPHPLGVAGRTSALAFSPNGQLFAAAVTSNQSRLDEQREHEVHLWDINSFNEVGTPIKFNLPVVSIQFDRRGDRLAVITSAKHPVTEKPLGEISLWDLQTKQRLGESVPDYGQSSSVRFLPGSQFMVASGKTTKLWQTYTAQTPRPAPPTQQIGRIESILGAKDRRAGIVVGNTHMISASAWTKTTSFRRASDPSPPAQVKVEHSATGISIGTIEVSAPVSAMCLSPDETSFAVAISVKDDMSEIQLANCQPCRVVRRISIPGNVVRLGLSRNNKSVFVQTSGGKNAPLVTKIVDIASGQAIRTKQPTAQQLLAVELSVDGRWVAVCSRTGTPKSPSVEVEVWNLLTGKVHGDAMSIAGRDADVRFTQDQNTLIVVSSRGFDHLDLRSNTLTTHGVSQVGSCWAVSPDGSKAIIGSSSTATLWDVKREQALKTIQFDELKPVPPSKKRDFHASSPNLVMFSPDGKKFVSVTQVGKDECRLRTWNAETAEEIGKGTALPTSGYGLRHFSTTAYWRLDRASGSHRFTSDGQYFLVKLNSGAFAVIDTSTGATGWANDVARFSVVPNTEFLTIIDKHGDLRRRSLTSVLQEKQEPAKSASDVTKASNGFTISNYFSPSTLIHNDGWLLGTTSSGTELWNVFERKRTCLIPASDLRPHSWVFPNPNATVLASVTRVGKEYGDKRKIRLWNPRSSEAVGSEFTAPEVIHAGCLSRDGKLIAVACSGNKLRRWDTDTWKEVGQPIEFESRINDICFDISDRVVFIGLGDRIEKRDVHTGETVGKALPWSVAYGSVIEISDSGKLLFVRSARSVEGWDLDSKQLALPLKSFGIPLCGFSIASDGIVHTATRTELQSWRVGTGELIRRQTIAVGDTPHAVYFRDDQAYVLTLDRTKSRATLHKMSSPVQTKADQIEAYIHTRSGHALDEDGEMHPISFQEWSSARDRSRMTGHPKPNESSTPGTRTETIRSQNSTADRAL